MMLRNFLIIFLVSEATVSFHGLNKIIASAEEQVGLRLRTFGCRRWRKENDSGFTARMSVVHNPGESEDNNPTESSVLIIVKPTQNVKDGPLEDVPDESSKNGSDLALPLHVTNTARQQCLDGYQADENGICQKMMQPKNDKSFKLRRRKREEQAAPTLSYADVVKYGRNPPKELLTTTEAEVLTEKPDIAKVPATTTLAPRTTRSKCGFFRNWAREAATTIRVAPATQKPAVIAVSTTLKPATPTSDASKTAKPAVEVTTPPVVAKFTDKPSISGDINQDFLLGEKSSIASQSMDGKVNPEVVPVSANKTVEVTRWKRFFPCVA